MDRANCRSSFEGGRYSTREAAGGLIWWLHQRSSVFTIFASAKQTKTGQNEHDRSRSALRRVRQIRCSYAGALPASCDMSRNSRTVDRKDSVLIPRRRYRSAQRNSLKESPWAERNKRVGSSGSTKLA
jgi:hypothetical protein